MRNWVRNWALWELPAPLVWSVLTVELAAFVLVAGGIAGSGGLAGRELWILALLCLAGMLHTEIAHQAEQVRRQLFDAELHVNLASVWFFAAAVLLSPAGAGLCAAVVYTHLWCRTRGPRAAVYRQLFSASVFVLASIAASAAMEWARLAGGRSDAVGGAVVIGVGVLVFGTVNSALVAGAIAVNNPRATVEQALGDRDANLLELGTLCLGGMLAAAMSINPWLVAFVLAPLLVLHRAVLVRHLQVAAATDAKTGLLNAATWHTRVEQALRRMVDGDALLAVLVLDLDHFKAVNDAYGHLAGDRVLVAVADTVRSQVRDRDLVGRFGGEEFVVLLAGQPDGCPEDLEAVADRIRRRVAGLAVEIPTPDGPLTVVGLSVSVGVAVHRGGPAELRDLLQIADTALYSAKRSGRNTVHMATVAAGPAPEAAVSHLAGRPGAGT